MRMEGGQPEGGRAQGGREAISNMHGGQPIRGGQPTMGGVPNGGQPVVDGGRDFISGGAERD